MRVKILAILMMGMMTFTYGSDMDRTKEKILNTQGFWKLYTDALRGDKVAQFQVGVMYERGMGVEKNETAAASWYEKSAIQGYSDGQFNIGIMYASGRGVELNQGFALMWLGLAAKQGDMQASNLLKELEKDKKNNLISDVMDREVVLVLKNRALICEKPTRISECLSYPEGLKLKSKIKQGDYYKISEMDSQRGWKYYAQEGWINQKDISINEDMNRTILSEVNEHEIIPVTFIVNKKAKVCIKPELQKNCYNYKMNTVLTSKIKYGDFYKISGMCTKKGWQPFKLTRWIHMENTKIRE